MLAKPSPDLGHLAASLNPKREFQTSAGRGAGKQIGVLAEVLAQVLAGWPLCEQRDNTASDYRCYHVPPPLLFIKWPVAVQRQALEGGHRKKTCL